MGHTACGAVKGAIQNVELGNLTNALSQIKIAAKELKFSGKSSADNQEYVNAVALKNIELSISEIKKKSSVLKELFDKKEIDIVGALYDHSTGGVKFL